MICTYDVQDSINPVDPVSSAKTKVNRVSDAISETMEKMVPHTLSVSIFKRLSDHMIFDQIGKLYRAAITNGAKRPHFSINFKAAIWRMQCFIPLFTIDMMTKSHLQLCRCQQWILGWDINSQTPEVPKRILVAGEIELCI